MPRETGSPALQAYLQRKEAEIEELMRKLVSEMIVAQAEDPEAYLLEVLQKRVAARTPTKPKIHSGFVENAYRLVFPFEEHFPSVTPHLQTVLPSGVVENDKMLKPQAEKGIIAYTQPQTLKPEVAPELAAELERTPFVWKRADGSTCVQQMWPTSFNSKFQSEFAISEANPDPAKFSTQAADEFRAAIVALYGEGADVAVPIRYCHRRTTNTKPVLIGTRTVLLGYLSANAETCAAMDIQSVSESGFVTGTIDGKGNKSSKDFTLAADGEYALYVKQGWETMACATPIEQFLPDRELLEAL